MFLAKRTFEHELGLVLNYRRIRLEGESDIVVMHLRPPSARHNGNQSAVGQRLDKLRSWTVCSRTLAITRPAL